MAQRSAKSGTAGSVLTWLFTNLEGTADVQTTANGSSTVQSYRDPFGAPITGTSQAWADGSGYMNKQVAQATGLTNVGARTYDPVLGKFLSVDPVIDTNLPQQNTGYAYSGNNPTTYKDPSGLKLDEGCGWAKSCSGTKTINSGSKSNSAVRSSGCGYADWQCQVAKTKKSDVRPCYGTVRGQCTISGSSLQPHPYKYSYKNRVATNSRVSAADAMMVFQQRPRDIFPFKVTGWDRFYTGAVCNLDVDVLTNVDGPGLAPVRQTKGTVGVTASATSVTFAVLSKGYFDYPGSAITFSTAVEDGQLYLKQDGYSVGSDLPTSRGAPVGALSTWQQQARNLSAILSEAP